MTPVWARGLCSTCGAPLTEQCEHQIFVLDDDPDHFTEDTGWLERRVVDLQKYLVKQGNELKAARAEIAVLEAERDTLNAQLSESIRLMNESTVASYYLLGDVEKRDAVIEAARGYHASWLVDDRIIEDQARYSLGKALTALDQAAESERVRMAQHPSSDPTCGGE